MDKLEKFLEFNGKSISILLADGTWWIAVKPICEALGVDYRRQHRTIQDHRILSELWSLQTTVAADKKIRKMVCLPEQFIYGWLFSINSDSPDLIMYQKACYEVLYNYFHGALTGRMVALSEKSLADIEMKELQQRLEERMAETEEYQRIQELKKKQRDLTKHLKKLDVDLLEGQLSFDFSDS